MMGGVKDPMGTKWTAGPAPASAARAAPEITGQGIPNPIGLILHLTPDLGGHSRTTDLTRAILAALL